jgi:hypothetical protein
LDSSLNTVLAIINHMKKEPRHWAEELFTKYPEFFTGAFKEHPGRTLTESAALLSMYLRC